MGTQGLVRLERLRSLDFHLPKVRLRVSTRGAPDVAHPPCGVGSRRQQLGQRVDGDRGVPHRRGEQALG